jgi:hypothetical protein
MKLSDIVAQFPPEYWKIQKEYTNKWFKSLTHLWYDMNFWRHPKEGDLADPQRCVDFEARLLGAVRSGDIDFIRDLLKAMKSESKPPSDFNAVVAAMTAFRQLFSPVHYGITCADWPTKEAVRERAEEMLRKAGHKIPTKRHWSRVFKQAGLAALPHGDSTW